MESQFRQVFACSITGLFFSVSLWFLPMQDVGTFLRTFVMLVILWGTSGFSVFLQLEFMFDKRWSNPLEEIYFLRIGVIWPLLVAMLWMACWPALDYQALLNKPLVYSPVQWPNSSWSEWYMKGGVLCTILGVGYWARSVYCKKFNLDSYKCNYKFFL